LKQIDARLMTLRALSDEASDIRISSVQIEDKLNAIMAELRFIVSKANLFPGIEDLEGRLNDTIAFFEDFLLKVRYAKELKGNVPFESFDQKRVELEHLLASLIEEDRGKI